MCQGKSRHITRGGFDCALLTAVFGYLFRRHGDVAIAQYSELNLLVDVMYFLGRRLSEAEVRCGVFNPCARPPAHTHPSPALSWNIFSSYMCVCVFVQGVVRQVRRGAVQQEAPGAVPQVHARCNWRGYRPAVLRMTNRDTLAADKENSTKVGEAAVLSKPI